MEGKPTQFLVDTGAQHLVLLQVDGSVSKKKKSWVQGATGTKMYSWTTQRTVDLRMDKAKCHPPVVVELKVQATLESLRQYSMSLEE